MLQPGIRGLSKSVHRSLDRTLAFLLSILFLQLPVIVTARTANVVQQKAAGSSGKDPDKLLLPRLKLGQPVERVLTAGEVQGYEIALEAGQFLHVVVDQLEINVSVAVVDPKKDIISKLERAPIGRQELLFLVAKESGIYKLGVQSPQDKAIAGRYRVLIKELRAPREGDISLATADKTLCEAFELGFQQTFLARHKALQKYRDALPLLRAARCRPLEMYALRAMGGMYYELGDEKNALEYFNQLLPITRELGDRFSESSALNDIGSAYYSLGDVPRALEYFKQALSIKREFGKYGQVSITLNNIGACHDSVGEKQKALEYFEEGLRVLQTPPGLEAGAEGTEVKLLHGAARILNSVGEHQKALDYYNRALSVSRTILSKRDEAASLVYLLYIHDSRGEHDKALDCGNRALSLQREFGDRDGEINTLAGIGRVYRSLGNDDKALASYEQALKTANAMGAGARLGRAIILGLIGEVHAARGETGKALDRYNEALPIMKEMGNPAGEAATLYNIAKAEQQAGSLSSALTHMEAAVDIIDSLRVKVAGSEYRSSFFASVEQYYEVYIDLLMRSPGANAADKPHGAAAFQAAERARARSLLEGLLEAQVDIRKGVDPSLLERERSVRQLLSGKNQRRVRLLGKTSAARLAEVTKEIEALVSEHRELLSQIRAKSPQYAALSHPQPISLEELQNKMLDAETLLLEYSLGAEQSYLWAVSHDSFGSFELPDRDRIESAARRVYNLLTARTRPYATTSERREAIERADAEYQEAAVALSRMLLGPVASLLSKKQILIVADGALEYIPFGALPTPQANSARSVAGAGPLVADHEIMSLPSASALAALRRETEGRQAPPMLVAVIADPVFDRADPRLGSAIRRRGNKRPSPNSSSTEPERGLTTSTMLIRSADDVISNAGPSPFPRLPFTRLEATSILAASPSGRSRSWVDFDATKAMGTSPELSKYRVIHFATHGLLNNKHPEMSGLVFSLFDRRGEPQDGFLQLNDIYNLSLSADLVVLSACQTALGKEVKREGIVGLTRGFMYSGARGVMASLWKVEDEATAELMKLFYEGLLKQGLTPAAALRAAEVQMLSSGKWKSPFYWAGFTLYGEWH